MEGYEEIEILNPGDNYISKIIKSCNNCQYKKHTLLRSGKYPIYIEVCKAIEDEDRQGFKLNTKLHKNVYGYYEPPGFDGEEMSISSTTFKRKINK